MTFVYYLFDHYEIFLYTLQQKIYKILYFQIFSFNFIVAITVFLFGIITSFTPCFISILPLAASYVNLANKYYINKSLFIWGIMNSFLLMIFFSRFVSFYTFFNKVPLLSSCILFLTSLNLLQVVDFTSLFYVFYQRSLFFDNFNLNINSYLAGFLIGVSTMPCNTSIIFIFIVGLGHIAKIGIFILYLIIYLVGCFLPLVAILNINNFNIFINYKNNFVLWFRKLFVSLGGSLTFILSLLSLLKKIYS